MSAQRRIHPSERVEPDVYFLPLALPEPKQFPGLDVGVVCRRIPDFLHQLINHGKAGPIGMLELGQYTQNLASRLNDSLNNRQLLN